MSNVKLEIPRSRVTKNIFIDIVNDSLMHIAEYIDRLIEHNKYDDEYDLKIIKCSLDMTKDLISMGMIEYREKKINMSVIAGWTDALHELQKGYLMLKQKYNETVKPD